MPQSADILSSIVRDKKLEVEYLKQIMSLTDFEEKSQITGERRYFMGTIERLVGDQQPAVIAEAKKASPSKGVIRANYDPYEIAQHYEQCGATCISVLTDQKYFMGSINDLEKVRLSCRLPILRKDFVIDAYQLHESKAYGADCILLIAAVLEKTQVLDLAHQAKDLLLDVIIEVHTEEELAVALEVPFAMIGINNRNLRNFETNIQTSIELKKSIPSDRVVISESGIHSSNDIQQLAEAGIHAYLIGEVFMREINPTEKMRELFFKPQYVFKS